MKTLRTVLLLTAVAALAASPALAGKIKTDPVMTSRGALDCSSAIVLNCGDVVTGDNTGMPNNVETYSCTGWTESGGEVVYTFTLDGDYHVTGTLSDMSADLDIWLLGSCDEADCLAYGNTSFQADLGAGTYYISVDGYNGAESSFTLTLDCQEILPPPPTLDGGETCADAVDLQAAGVNQFSVDLTGYANDYTGADCFSWGTNGGDAVYKIYLAQGEMFTATEDGSCDMAMYVMADCESGTALACSDNCCSGAQELVSFTAPADGWYYLIVDAYTSSGCPVVVTIDQPVANEDTSWSTLKTQYR